MKNLHTAGNRPEWESNLYSHRNRWQKLATWTGGIITPANVLDGVAFAIGISGMRDFEQGRRRRGIVKVGVSRLIDNVDGLVADLTQTKSPLGEAIDAGRDKAELARALPVLYNTTTMPRWLIAAMGVRGVGQTMLAVVGKARHTEMHPSDSGKKATFLEWGIAGLYELHDLAAEYDKPELAQACGTAAVAATAVYLAYAGPSFIEYAQQAFGERAIIDASLPEDIPAV